MGIVAWALIGVVVVVGGIFLGLAATSQVVLPLLFTLMLGAVGAPLVTRLIRLRIPAGLASAIVVIAAVLLVVGVIALVVGAVVSQSSLIVEQIDTAVDGLSEQFGLGEDLLERTRDALESMGGTLGEGTVTAVMGGLNATVAFIVGRSWPSC